MMQTYVSLVCWFVCPTIGIRGVAGGGSLWTSTTSMYLEQLLTKHGRTLNAGA